MSRRVALSVVLLLVAAAILLFWERRSSDDRFPPGPPAHDASAGPTRSEVPSFVPGVVLRALVASSPAPVPAPNGAFEGHVVSTVTGAPIAGAQLTFARAEETSSVASAPDGRFRFDARVPGRWLLAAATAPDFLPFAPEWGQSPVQLEARPGEVVRGVTVALEPAEEIEGRVVDEQRAPIAGALVHIQGGGLGTSTLVAVRDRDRTDERGTFRFTAPESAIVEVRASGFATARARVDHSVRSSRRLTVALTRLATPSLTIDGLVEDEAGAPLAGAVLHAAPRDPPGAPPASTRSDDRGAFRFDELGPGRWRITATLGELAPRTIEVAAGSTGVRLRLATGSRIAGRVRDRSTGSPVAPFTIVVQGAVTRSLSVIDPDGRYELGGLASGPAVVTAFAPGWAPSPELRVVVPAAGDPPATADFELSRGGRLTGAVVARGDRRPIARARVAVEGTAASLGVPVRNETITDEAGRFTVGGLGESTVGLLVSARGHHGRVVTVPSVRDGDTQGPVTIDLAPVSPGEEERLEVAGIGAALLKQGASLVVTMVAPSGGAAEAGITVGDELVAIDGAPVAPMTLAEAIPRLRGPEGSTVTLGVVKAGDAQRTAIPVVVARRVVRT